MDRALAGEFAGVAFTAPSSLSVWLDSAHSRRDDLVRALRRVRRIAIGKTTAAYLSSIALSADAVATAAEEEAIGEAIERALG